jgi:hypothetical protein
LPGFIYFYKNNQRLKVETKIVILLIVGKGALPAQPTPCGFAPLRVKRGARRSEQTENLAETEGLRQNVPPEHLEYYFTKHIRVHYIKSINGVILLVLKKFNRKGLFCLWT